IDLQCLRRPDARPNQIALDLIAFQLFLWQHIGGHRADGSSYFDRQPPVLQWLFIDQAQASPDRIRESGYQCADAKAEDKYGACDDYDHGIPKARLIADKGSQKIN
ncbi:MAG: hypothetical protein ACREQ1_07430, partial [Woeseiaceae bacterium]